MMLTDLPVAEDRQARQVAELTAADPQFAAAQPDQAVADAIAQPGLVLPQIVRTALAGYADRPALGQRAVAFVTDAGRTVAQLQPRYDTISYGELAERVRALSAALVAAAVRPGDRVAVLGFTSVDYTVIDIALGQIDAVSVPLQTSAAVSTLTPIVTETEPRVIAASIDSLADAVELVRTGPAPPAWSSSITTSRSTTTVKRWPTRARSWPAPRSSSSRWPSC